jgi:hypothetical protein
MVWSGEEAKTGGKKKGRGGGQGESYVVTLKYSPNVDIMKWKPGKDHPLIFWEINGSKKYGMDHPFPLPATKSCPRKEISLDVLRSVFQPNRNAE